MDLDRVVELVRALPFRQAVWLFPFATALHFLEEAPQFANWASKYALPSYTCERWLWYLSQLAHHEGLLTNVLGLVALLIAVVIHTLDVATSVFGVGLRSS